MRGQLSKAQGSFPTRKPEKSIWAWHDFRQKFWTGQGIVRVIREDEPISTYELESLLDAAVAEYAAGDDSVRQTILDHLDEASMQLFNMPFLSLDGYDQQYRAVHETDQGYIWRVRQPPQS